MLPEQENQLHKKNILFGGKIAFHNFSWCEMIFPGSNLYFGRDNFRSSESEKEEKDLLLIFLLSPLSIFHLLYTIIYSPSYLFFSYLSFCPIGRQKNPGKKFQEGHSIPPASFAVMPPIYLKYESFQRVPKIRPMFDFK